MKLLIFVALQFLKVVFNLFYDWIVAELLQNFLERGHSLTYKIFPQFPSNWHGLVGGSSSMTLRFDT